MQKHIQYFQSILETEQVRTESKEIHEFAKDRTKQFPTKSEILLFPKSNQDLSKILAYCNTYQLAVVASGGRTGLSGAAVASNNEIVLSFDKMNRIIEVDPIASTIELEAGCILQDAQEAAAKVGLLFPIDFAAKGSAQIGGMVSTNAGGIKVVKYGMTRDCILGLEVILATGESLDLNRKLIKDNSGYDLRQLFIGAEGTLGLISKVSIQCVAMPKNLNLALFACSDFDRIPKVLAESRKAGHDLSAFEFFSNQALHAVLEHSEEKHPFEDESPYYILIEIDEKEEDELFHLMETLAELDLIDDASIASSSAEFERFWSFREGISESISMLGHVHKNDISVPIAELSNFIPNLELLIQAKYQNYELLLFGHIADGNIHINIVDRSEKNLSDFSREMKELDINMFRLIESVRGSISAEHGIGLTKKTALSYRRSPEEIELMRGIKAIFDPNGILNPSKIFD